ncbi:uncharacterized protein LOC132050966 [Lycium ferocissimum]|uniref:uncharacterized protein LOC132050966 n=1 Tax=Lycium ferocissimum TaxID=112874 RepID=UPI002816310B|nr:uncharacterized protein LOC132050966 [Lycium ferocissimum]
MRLSYCSSMGERMMGVHELTLRLSSLDEFSGLVKLELGEDLPPVGTFSHLCKLHVSSCNKMKKLIPRWLMQYLLNLMEIVVDCCAEMEEIMSEDEDEQAKQCASSASSSSPFPSNESKSIKDEYNSLELSEAEETSIYSSSSKRAAISSFSSSRNLHGS